MNKAQIDRVLTAITRVRGSITRNAPRQASALAASLQSAADKAGTVTAEGLALRQERAAAHERVCGQVCEIGLLEHELVPRAEAQCKGATGGRYTAQVQACIRAFWAVATQDDTAAASTTVLLPLVTCPGARTSRLESVLLVAHGRHNSGH